MNDNQELDLVSSDGSRLEVSESAGLSDGPSIHRDDHYARMADTSVVWHTEMDDQLTTLSQKVDSEPSIIEELERSHPCRSPPTFDDLQQFQGLSEGVFQHQTCISTLPFECPAPILSISSSVSPPKLPSRDYTPTGLNLPPGTPYGNCSPTISRYTTGSLSFPPDYTATLEQSALNGDFGGKQELIIVDMDKQDNKSLLLRFFEQINVWTENYTVDVTTLDAEQSYGLTEHPAFAEILNRPAQLRISLTEQTSLDAIVAGFIIRHICMHAWDEHFLQVSGHPQAAMCEELSLRWSRLPEDAFEAKHSLLLSQQQIYTSIKNENSHSHWRYDCASKSSTDLLSSLSGLLRTNMAKRGFSARDEALCELYDKGYKIGFRLHMTPSQWSFQWPLVDAELMPTAIHEYRGPDGDVQDMNSAVVHKPETHEARFAVTPTISMTEFDGGEKKRTLVHDAVVQHATVLACTM